jgi:outer membrane protein OmpA-like peptidoglycan-associated protein
MIRKSPVLLLAALFAWSCATSDDDPNKHAKRGAEVGAVAGAIVGAILGNQTGNPRTGAIIGAAAGAALGASTGHDMDKQEQELRQIPGVEVTRVSPNELDVHFTNEILFDTDSVALREESRKVLDDLAGNFARYPDEQITIEGHTDAVGSAEEKQFLSQRRANTVREYLIAAGIGPRQITAEGFGDTRPKASNDTPEGRQLNRRVEIRITAPSQH